MPLQSVKACRLSRIFAANVVAILLLAFFFFGTAAPAAADGDKRKELVLFGTREFRSSIKSLPKWIRVVDFEKNKSTFENLKDTKASEWLKIKANLSGKGIMDKLKSVNSFFNKWPYRTDMEAWKTSDYWAVPEEFIRKSGDCEDYAITKYYALKDLGVPIADMRIVILKDTTRNLDHAVLAVDVEGTIYILDNVSNLILTDKKLTHYKPYFSVNENFRWVHLPPDSSDPSKSVIK